MKYKGVTTLYPDNGRYYSSYILAGSMNDAEQLRRERNIGERITSDIIKLDTLPDYRNLANDEFVKQIAEITEQVAFLSYLLFASGKMRLEHVMGNSSLLKRMIALRSIGIPTEIILPLRAELGTLQQLAPGVFPFSNTRQGNLVTVSVKPGSSRTIENIITGSIATNLGPASITVCDCALPVPIAIGSMITDDDQPCGHEQTIEARMAAALSTEKTIVHLINKDATQPTRVQIMVKYPALKPKG